MATLGILSIPGGDARAVEKYGRTPNVWEHMLEVASNGLLILNGTGTLMIG